MIALGRALAAGLVAADNARILTEPFVMAALADIEAPHASLLDLLVCHWPLQTPQGVVADPFTAPPRSPGTPWGAGFRIWLAEDIVAARPALRPVLPSLLGTLQRHGLAAQSDDPGDPFGRTGPAMQQRWISEVAEKQRSAGGLSTVVNAQFYAPGGRGYLQSWARRSLTPSWKPGPRLRTEARRSRVRSAQIAPSGASPLPGVPPNWMLWRRRWHGQVISPAAM